MPIPPLASLRAFEAVARHLSFTRAAEELGMTQAAVSYQIRLLEERLASGFRGSFERFQDVREGVADFLGTMTFLFDSPDQTVAMTDELRRYRRALQGLNDYAGQAEARHELKAARDALQKRLLTVMVRTERVSATSRRDSMVEERIVSCAVGLADVAQAISLDRVRDAVGAQDIIEYWKSAPYLLSFMKGYDVINRLGKHVRTGARIGQRDFEGQQHGVHLRPLLRSASFAIRPSMPLALISCANWVR